MTRSPQETIAINEIGFRARNERIEAAANGGPLVSAVPFICECADLGCSEIVSLTHDEYEAVRLHPRRFFNLPGHEVASVTAGAEVALTIYGSYTVIEKIGIAGDIAQRDRTQSYP